MQRGGGWGAWRVVALAACARHASSATASPATTDAGGDGATATACAAGSMADETGACVVAGVPATACAPGFVGDGAGGCAPVLPPAACADGLFARPGETSCAEIAPCGDAPFPDVPDASNAQFVDASAAPESADGTRAHPWKTVQAGVDHVAPGGSVAIAAGTYAEEVVVDKSLALIGRCPRLVQLVEAPPALQILRAESGGPLSIGGLTIAGGFDSAHVALFVSGGTITVSRSRLIGSVALLVLRGRAEIADSLLEPSSNGLELTEASGRVTGSVFRGHAVTGVDAQLPTGIQASAPDPVAADASPPALDVEVSGSVFEDVEIALATTIAARVDGTLLRDIGAQASAASAIETTGAELDVTRSVFTSLAGGGVYADTAPTTIETSTFRGVVFPAIEVGISSPKAAPPPLVVRATSIARATNCAIFVTDSPATLERVSVADTRGPIPIGICGALATSPTPWPLAVRGSRVQGGITGIYVQDTSATVTGTEVAETTSDANGAYGDAIDVTALTGDASVGVEASLVRAAARAGVAAFGARVDIHATTLRDCAIDLDGEAKGARPFDFRDLGENHCVVGTLDRTCAVQSARLAPPAPVRPDP